MKSKEKVLQRIFQIAGKSTRYAICGALRRMGESDDAILRLAQRDGIIPKDSKKF